MSPNFFNDEFPQKFIISLLIIFFVVLSESPAQDEKKYISFSFGIFDVLQNEYTSVENRIEYRGSELYQQAKLILGAMYNSDGALHLFAGSFVDIPIFPFLYISPSFAPGIYYHSNSKDLDFLLEFRSQVEVALKLDNDVKVGLSFNHISNASLGRTNPGVESLALTYHLPL